MGDQQLSSDAGRPAVVRGWFVTLEGGEGAGKSTQIKLLDGALRQKGLRTLVTREPGGSPGGEAVRHVLLSGAAEPLGAEMEAILFSAARSDHVETVIRPVLERGISVLCDRFYDSTRVYQGATGKVDLDFLKRLERIACQDCWPDITVILDLDPKIGIARAAARRGEKEAPDRFERETLALHTQRRQAFLEIARTEPERCIVVDASAGEQAVHRKLFTLLRERMKAKRPGWHNEAILKRVGG
jgi:dTMP kinase